jgi:hypothetical protein
MVTLAVALPSGSLQVPMERETVTPG